jgi:hypothetical protein
MINLKNYATVKAIIHHSRIVNFIEAANGIKGVRWSAANWLLRPHKPVPLADFRAIPRTVFGVVWRAYPGPSHATLFIKTQLAGTVPCKVWSPCKVSIRF